VYSPIRTTSKQHKTLPQRAYSVQAYVTLVAGSQSAQRTLARLAQQRW